MAVSMFTMIAAKELLRVVRPPAKPPFFVDAQQIWAGITLVFCTLACKIPSYFGTNHIFLSIFGLSNHLKLPCNRQHRLGVSEVYGALMWNLGKILQTPEVARMYVGSFWDDDYKCKDPLGRWRYGGLLNWGSPKSF